MTACRGTETNEPIETVRDAAEVIEETIEEEIIEPKPEPEETIEEEPPT